MKTKTRQHKQKPSHPFRRHIATTKENAGDEFFEVTHGSIIADRQGNPRAAGGGHGR